MFGAAEKKLLGFLSSGFKPRFKDFGADLNKTKHGFVIRGQIEGVQMNIREREGESFG